MTVRGDFTVYRLTYIILLQIKPWIFRKYWTASTARLVQVSNNNTALIVLNYNIFCLECLDYTTHFIFFQTKPKCNWRKIIEINTRVCGIQVQSQIYPKVFHGQLVLFSQTDGTLTSKYILESRLLFILLL